MTPYDATIAGVVIAGMIWGACRGLAWQAASIASLILGYAAAHGFSGQLAPYLPGEPIVAKALAMVLLYVAVSGAIHLAAWSARATLRKMRFEAYDRHLGMVLGGVEGAFLGMIGTIFVVGLVPSTREPILNSPSGKIVSASLRTCQSALPKEYRQMLTRYCNVDDVPASPDASVARRAEPAKPAEETTPNSATVATPATADSASLEDRLKGKVSDALRTEGSRLEREAKNEIERRIERLGGRQK